MDKKQQLISDMQKHGFVDKSHNKNGFAYRKDVNSITEICFYTDDNFPRFQTIQGGMTIEMLGVETIEDLNQFWMLMTGESLF